MIRTRALVLLACPFILAACSIPDITQPDSEAAATGFERVESGGVSFESPEGWEEFDAEEISEGVSKDDAFADMAQKMGVTPEQFEQQMAAIDLFLFDDEGMSDGFADNINVLTQPGRRPNAEQLKLQLHGLGAKILGAEDIDTDLGETAFVTYRLNVRKVRIHGASIIAESPSGGAVAVTVSTGDEDTTVEIANRIIETLEKD